MACQSFVAIVLILLYAFAMLISCSYGKPAYNTDTVDTQLSLLQEVTEFKETRITTDVAINFNIRELDGASLDDLPYRLDLVDCPRAPEVPQSSATYKTTVYYKNRHEGYRCCSRQKAGQYETESIQLDNNNEAVVSGTYEQGLLQRISFQSSDDQGCLLTNLRFDLPPPVRLGGKAICNDYLLFIFDGVPNNLFDCELCGNQSRLENIANCWGEGFDNVSVTFRTSYREFNPPFKGGFNFTIKCFPKPMGQISQPMSPVQPAMVTSSSTTTRTMNQCLDWDPNLTSLMYINDQEKQLEASLLDSNEQMSLRRIPIDATEVLADYYNRFVSSGMKDDSMVRLAELCQYSCDEALANLAQEILK